MVFLFFFCKGGSGRCEAQHVLEAKINPVALVRSFCWCTKPCVITTPRINDADAKFHVILSVFRLYFVFVGKNSHWPRRMPKGTCVCACARFVFLSVLVFINAAVSPNERSAGFCLIVYALFPV